MISKLAASIIVSVATLVLAVPTTGFAKSSNPSKTNALFKQLKKLPANAPVAKINKLVKQLTQLDPSKATTYLKQALKKDLSTADADKVTKTANTAVQKSDLPPSQKNSITKKNDKANDDHTPPAPTPTPYQA
jgi:hypothetical protein